MKNDFAALEEESKMNHQYGRFMNHNLSEYHVPVNKDINDMEVIFVEEKDQSPEEVLLMRL